VDHLQDFASNYNATYHSTIGMPPDKVTKAKEVNLWWRMYWPKKIPFVSKPKKVRKPFKFKVGDHVQISHLRNVFSREYDEKWSREIFVISERRIRGGLPIYRLKDYLNEEINGTFYKPELQQEAQGPHRSPESYWPNISHINTCKVTFLYCGPNRSGTMSLTT
jgi:hypothetical protein